jgi:hypothetical protein
MSRKREPVAEIGEDDYRIVRHTHDIELASHLMRAKISEDECPRYTMEDLQARRAHVCTQECEDAIQSSVDPGKAKQVYVRILGAIPGSLAEAEGWAFQYYECERGRGAFPAVVFR